MEPLTEKQYDKIKHVLPVQRGNVRIDNLTFLNAIFYVAENGCKWRKLPESFGPWHTIYMRMRRWADNGVWPDVPAMLQSELGVTIEVTAISLDSTSIKVHPDGMGPLKKTDNNRSAKAEAVGIQKFT